MDVNQNLSILDQERDSTDVDIDLTNIDSNQYNNGENGSKRTIGSRYIRWDYWLQKLCEWLQ